MYDVSPDHHIAIYILSYFLQTVGTVVQQSLTAIPCLERPWFPQAAKHHRGSTDMVGNAFGRGCTCPRRGECGGKRRPTRFLYPVVVDDIAFSHTLSKRPIATLHDAVPVASSCDLGTGLRSGQVTFKRRQAASRKCIQQGRASWGRGGGGSRGTTA